MPPEPTTTPVPTAEHIAEAERLWQVWCLGRLDGPTMPEILAAALAAAELRGRASMHTEMLEWAEDALRLISDAAKLNERAAEARGRAEGAVAAARCLTVRWPS